MSNTILERPTSTPILATGTPLAMSSHEIAKLTGKTHKNVLRDIDIMLKQLIGDGSNLIHQAKSMGCVFVTDARGYTAEISLPKNLTINLITGYRADLRLKVIDRWLELEGAGAPKVPTNMREALMLALEQQEKLDEQGKELAIVRPKAAAHDYLSELPGELGVRDAGRELKVGQKLVTDYIDGHGWSCVEGGKRKPAHYGLKQGYCRFVHKPYTHPHTGEEMVKEEFRLTRKGIGRLAEIIAKIQKENGVPFARRREPVS